MGKQIIIRTSDVVRPNAFKIHFQCFMNYLRDLNLFHRDPKNSVLFEKPVKISTEKLWELLVEDGKHDLVKILQHVENKDIGYGSIVMPAQGFSEDDNIHNMVLDWLLERNINIVNVGHEIACLKRSLYPEAFDELHISG